MYIDDITILSRSQEEQLLNTAETLKQLMDASMTMVLKKCHFFCKFIDHPGHVIVIRKLQVARKTTEDFSALWLPTTVSQMRSFFSLWNGYRSFLLGFAKIAAPLNLRLRKVASTVWAQQNGTRGSRRAETQDVSTANLGFTKMYWAVYARS